MSSVADLCLGPIRNTWPRQTCAAQSVADLCLGFLLLGTWNQIGVRWAACPCEPRAAERPYLAEVDADHWKTWVHERLATPVGQSGALALFDAPKFEHQDFCRQLTAETKLEEFVPGRGVVIRWQRVRRANHWLDALYNAAAAGYFVGARLLEETPVERPKPTSREEIEEENMRRWGRKSWVDPERVRNLQISMRRRGAGGE